MATTRFGRTTAAAFTAAALAGSAAILGGCLIVIDADKGTTGFIAGDQFVHSDLVVLDVDDLETYPRLSIINPSGDVSLIATDGPARIEIDAYSRDRKRARGVRVDAKRTDRTTLTIEPDWPGTIRDNESCDLIVYVPVRDGVEIQVRGGEIEIEGMAGTMVAETRAGDIEVRSHDGPASLSTSAGDIEANHVKGSVEAETNAGDVDLYDVGWPIRAVTKAGDVTVAMRHGFSGDLHATSSTGSIDLPGSSSSSRERGATTVTQTVGDGATDQRCDFNTSAGDIGVRVLPPAE